MWHSYLRGVLKVYSYEGLSNTTVGGQFLKDLIFIKFNYAYLAFSLNFDIVDLTVLAFVCLAVHMYWVWLFGQCLEFTIRVRRAGRPSYLLNSSEPTTDICTLVFCLDGPYQKNAWPICLANAWDTLATQQAVNSPLIDSAI